MSRELINKVLAEVVKKVGGDAPAPSATLAPTPAAGALPTVTKLAGINILGDTIGMVIANVDLKPHAMMKLEKDFRSIGIFGARADAGPHVFAADEAVKATNSEILTIELPHNTKGGVGHGLLIISDAEDVFNAHHAVEVAFGELDRTFGDIYDSGADHLEFQRIVRVPYTFSKAFSAPIDKAFGITVDVSASISVVSADTAVKTATADVISYASPAGRTSYPDEVVSFLSGDSGTVRQAIIAAHEVGVPLLGALGAKSEFTTTPYIRGPI